MVGPVLPGRSEYKEEGVEQDAGQQCGGQWCDRLLRENALSGSALSHDWIYPFRPQTVLTWSALSRGDRCPIQEARARGPQETAGRGLQEAHVSDR